MERIRFAENFLNVSHLCTPLWYEKKRKIVYHHPHAFGKLVHWLFISSDVYAAVLELDTSIAV